MTTENNLAIVDWEPHDPPTDLIFDDGEVLESNRHRIAMNVLIRSLQQAWSDRSDYFTGGNMFIYYSSTQIRNRDFRGPDFFAVLNVDGTNSRQGWVVWEEDGRYPDVIVELMSRSTAAIDKGIKKDLYEQTFRTSDYFVYDPFDPNSLQGWHLDENQEYQPLTPNQNGWLWCRRLGFWLGTWEGTIDRETAIWVRFYDVSGNLVLLPEEEAKAREEEAKAREEEAKAREEEAKAREEEAKAREEEAKAQAARLAARLRELGENPDML
ncbi:Uma2 family endonuclease [Anabaena azotica]|uniref:Uma2 family endonuclease n=1 Tax=Anabaena azotica TaxID=197653 RepID=UPI0039A6290D